MLLGLLTGTGLVLPNYVKLMNFRSRPPFSPTAFTPHLAHIDFLSNRTIGFMSPINRGEAGGADGQPNGNVLPD